MAEKRRVRAYVTPETWRRVEDFIHEKHGSVDGNISKTVEAALIEYIDDEKDMASKEKQHETHEMLEETLTLLREQQTTHTHKQGGHGGHTVKEKAEAIAAEVREQGEAIKTTDLEDIIGDIAGEDPRTVRKYKRILRRRQLLYEDPGESPVWFTSVATWSHRAEHEVPTTELDDFLNQYGMSIEEFDEALPETDVSRADGGHEGHTDEQRDLATEAEEELEMLTDSVAIADGGEE